MFVTRRLWKLLTDDGYFGRRHFEPHEAMIRVEEKKDFDIRRGDTEAFVRFAAGGSGADGFGCNRAGRNFLRNQHGECLRAALGPVIDTSQKSVVVVHVVVEDGDKRGIEADFLFVRASALDGE